MIRSLEVRWFLASPPFPASAFFQVAETPASRTDWYAFPCDNRCGIKTREGRLETKMLVEVLGTRTLGGATGKVEVWEKWSVSFPPNDIPPDERLASTGWVPVKKARYLRVFEVKNHSVTEVHDHKVNWPGNGCQFEWTELTSGTKKWWTIGFEAFGPAVQLQDNLRLVVEHVFSAEPAHASTLKQKDSFAYPRWLEVM